MCGRYTLRTPVETLAREFEITVSLPEVQARLYLALPKRWRRCSVKTLRDT